MPMQEFHPLQTIDHSQQNGNVFALLGIVSRLAPTCDKNFKDISAEMISADYVNAVFVFSREFGEFFNIILPPYLSLQDLENAHKKATMSSKDSESVLLIDKML